MLEKQYQLFYPEKIEKFEKKIWTGKVENKFDDLINRVICDDNLNVLKSIPNNAIDLVITLPPYFNQRDYGEGIGNEKKIDDYIHNLLKVFEQCYRIINDKGSIVFNIGDKYLDASLQLIPYRFAVEVLKEFKVKLVNEVTWVKTNPTPRQYKRRLVSSTEPFFHFVKNKNYYYDYNSFLEEKKKRIEPKPYTKMGRNYFRLIENSDLSSIQKEAALKELKDVINDVKLGRIESFRMKIKGIHKEAFGGQNGGRAYHMKNKGFTIIRLNGDSLKKDIVESAVETIKDTNHPAVYPLKVIKEFIKLLTPENSIVLDPFNGSGTTCLAAKNLRRRYIGIDINKEYCEIAMKRLGELYD